MLHKVVFCAATLLCSTSVHAGVLSSVLTANGLEDRLSTTSPAGLAAVVKANGKPFNPNLPAAASLKSGDVIYGFVAANSGVNDHLSSSASSMNFSGGHAIGMFSAEVQEQGNRFNLVTPTNSALRLASLVDSSFAADFAGFEDQAMFAMLSGGVGTQVTEPLLSADNTGGGGLKYFTSSDYGVDFLANTSDFGDGDGFFQFEGFGGDLNPLIGQVRAGFNVISGAGSMGNVNFANVAINSLFDPTISEADIAVDSTFVSVSVNDSETTRGWNLRSTSDGIRLNVVPEPTSIVSFAGLAILGLGGIRRRKNRVATA